jgi:predicted nucleic acid-binding protein
MRDLVFIDTRFWVALLDERDQNHKTAKRMLKPLMQNYVMCFSEFIVFETITYLNCSLKRHDLALRFLIKTKAPGLLVFEIDKSVKFQAIELFKKYSDKNLSITDCTSFVIMKSKKFHWYAGFDDHFQQVGFSNMLHTLSNN